MLFFVVAHLGAEVPQGGEDLKSAIRAWAASDSVSLRVTAVSSQTYFRAGLTSVQFEAYVATRGSDCEIEIRSESTARHVGSVFLDSSFKDGPENLAVDVRQRVDFMQGGRMVLTVYVGLAGDILWQNRELHDRARTGLFRRITRELGERL